MNYIKILFILSIIINCYAQKVYKNTNIPKDEKLNFVLKERAVCDFNNCDDSFVSNRIFIPNQVDKDSSFFFLDSKNSKVVKFDKNGKFINSFANAGNGPGEFPNFCVINFYITNDSLYLVNHCERNILVFDTDGKFTCNRLFSNESHSGGTNMIVKNNETLIYDSFWGMYGKQKLKLVLADLNMKIFKEIYCLDTEDTPAEIMSGKHELQIACSDDNIYMYVSGDYGLYLISVYDYNGNLKYKIKKNYRKLKTNKDKLKKTLEKHGISKRGLSEYKTPIHYMFCDQEGRLFVRSSKDDDKDNCSYFDIFQNGEFMNRIAFEISENIDRMIYRNDFAYALDCTNNSITVYQYEEVR